MRKLFCIILIVLSLNVNAQERVLRNAMPDCWQENGGAEQILPSDDRWWQRFDDPVLDSLIRMGEDANFDIAMAYRRMEAASQQIAIARSAYYPTIEVSGNYVRRHQDGSNHNNWNIGASSSWQIDIFGKVTTAVHQRKAQYRASRAEWIGTMVSMAGNISSTYIQLRVWQSELAVAERHTVVQDSITELVKARYDCGLGAKPQLAQARAQLHSIRGTIPQLKTSIASAISSLALLTGRYATEIEAMLSGSSALPDYRQIVQAGIPSELLRRRPDIIEAESQLAAAAATVGIAKKDFLPTLTLEGNIGVSAERPGDLFSDNIFSYTIAPTISWTLFDGFSRQANVAAAREEMEAQIANYNSIVVNAYNEVSNALTKYHNCLRQIEEYDEATANAREFLYLSLDLYTQGLSPYSDVATAQQSLLNYNNSLLIAQGEALGALVTLYVALGGGFGTL